MAKIEHSRYRVANSNDPNYCVNLRDLRRGILGIYAGSVFSIYRDDNAGADIYYFAGKFGNVVTHVFGLDVVRSIDMWGDKEGKARVKETLEEQILGRQLIEGVPV